MDLTDQDKALVIALGTSSVPPAMGMQRHFQLVLAGKARPASSLEREWLMYWLAHRRFYAAADDSCIPRPDDEALENSAWIDAFVSRVRRLPRIRVSIAEDVPKVGDPFWLRRPDLERVAVEERPAIERQFAGVLGLLEVRSWLYSGEVRRLAGCFRCLTAPTPHRLTAEQIAGWKRIWQRLYGSHEIKWMQGGAPGLGKRH